MSDDDSAGSSLLLAQHNDRAHREHHHDHNQYHNHNVHTHSHSHSHSHQHQADGGHDHDQEQQRLQRRQLDGTDTSSTVTIETIAVVQQITVDENGHTLGVQTFEPVTLPPGTATPLASLTLTPVPPAASNSPSPPLAVPSLPTPPTLPSLSIPAIPTTLPFSPVGLIISSSTSTAGVDTLASQSLLSSSSISAVLTSTPPTSAVPTSFASFPINSTSVSNRITTNSTSLTASFFNSTTTSSILATSSLLPSSTSSFASSDSIVPFITTEAPAAGTDGSAILGGAGNPASSTSSSIAGSGNGSGSNSNSSTPAVIGGVVGSIAGLAMIIFLLLFILRWRKGKPMLSLSNRNSEPGATTQTATGSGPQGPPPMGMTQRALPAALTAMPLYKRFSQKSESNRTVSSAGAGERSFYRVSGRKLPSVLQTGGDGYGGEEGLEDMSLRGSSFYRDSKGGYGPGTPTFPGAIAGPLGQIGLQAPRESVMPTVQPGPARTPVTTEGPFADPPSPSLNPPRRPDVLGRSHPSQDGSHTSRFTEEV
ncbi:hypothetical protein F5884DRAFT_101286 [Xylogone sp. PMI_703]|nr:hypothetical protein F5884DRAFT_101286 [Xylogone sp. PMI_703]